MKKCRLYIIKLPVLGKSMLFYSIIFLFCNYNLCKAQQPGGVSGTKIWYVTGKIDGRMAWIDNSMHNFKAVAAGLPAVNINFHASLQFQGNIIPIKHENVNLSQASVVGLFYPFYNGNQPASSVFYEIKLNGISIFKFQPKLIKDSSGNELKYDPDFLLSGNGVNSAMKTASFTYTKNDRNTSIWKPKKSSTLDIAFKGIIPELIIYNRILTPAERLKVETYLSIKYGTTLDNSYLGSNDNVLWNIDTPALKKFHHRIFAIGKDTQAGIWQPKSNSTYDEGFNSYNYHADDQRTNTALTYIPKLDSPSLYRSITMNFVDKSLSTLDERKFIFLGDDNQSIKKEQFIARFPSFPGMLTPQRNWIVYNQSNVANQTRLVIAGADYKNPTLFNTLYDPYDYQLYRYVLVKLKSLVPAEIDSVLLCKYFGREQDNSGQFSTRTIVWDDVSWGNKHSAYNYFTLGRVPILNFLQIGKTKNDIRLKNLNYPFHRNTEITSETNFDIESSSLIFRNTDTDFPVYFTVSEGVPPLKAKIYRLLPNGTIGEEIKNAITEATGTVLPPEPGGDLPPATDETEVLPPPPATPGKIENIIRKKSITKQVKKAYVISRLIPNASYLIVVTDRINQKTTIPIKITKQ